MAPDRLEVETDVLPLVVLLPAGVLAAVTGRFEVGVVAPVGGGVVQAAGAALFAGGVGVWLWSVLELRRGGSSSAAPTGVLVESGPYRYSRNPMYVGVVAAVLGEAAFFGSLPAAVVAAGVWLLFRSMVLRWEEPLVRERIGEPFEAYCDRVPRWLPPFG